MSIEAHYYCHNLECVKKVEVLNLRDVGKYRIGAHLYCKGCFDTMIKEREQKLKYKLT